MFVFSHFANRLRDAELMLDPYPHYCLENIFPDDYYQALLRNLPGSSSYQNLFDVTTLKLDHFRHRDQRDMNPGWTDNLPAEQKEFWNNFDSWFLGADLAQAVVETFSDQMHSRFGAAWPEVSVESQLIRHRAGYFLEPHSDLLHISARLCIAQRIRTSPAPIQRIIHSLTSSK
jgi:hypothetical protein